MVLTSDLLKEHRKLIRKILSESNGYLSLLELKKKTKLANLYFFKALEELETKEILKKSNKGNEIFIILHNRINKKS